MASFFASLVGADLQHFRLVNERTGLVVADRLRTAFDSASRRRGLLADVSLPEDTALLIAPTSAIHTFGMRFTIDVLFVARDGRVLKTSTSLVPSRISLALFAHGVIETAEGTVMRTGTRAGDRIVIDRR